MKIEIDTKVDSRHELAILAEMLQKLSGAESGTVLPKRLKPKDIKKRNIFDDPAPSGGIFNMFGGDSSSSASSPSEPGTVSSQPADDSPVAGGLFSIFGDTPSQPAASEPEQHQGKSVAELLSEQEDMPKLIDPEQDAVEENKTSVQDVLDDDRIVPY